MTVCFAYHTLVCLGVRDWDEWGTMSGNRWAELAVILKSSLGEKPMQTIEVLRSRAQRTQRAQLLVRYGVRAFIRGNKSR